jgi:uncharacterized protein (DUF1501 family)
MTDFNSSRRYFLRQALGTLGTASYYSSIASLLGASAIASAGSSSDYKALVCVLLAGGNDSYNMLIPNDSSRYDIYSASRSDLALSQTALANTQIQATSGADLNSYALHPALTGVKSLFDSGDAALLANAGTLVEPIDNATQVDSNSKQLPLGLYSHSDQISQWQTSTPDKRSGQGWGGRVADALNSLNASANADISMNISTAGSNVFQTGNTVVDYSVQSTGTAAGISGYGTNIALTTNIDALLSQQYPHIFSQGFATKTQQSIAANIAFNEAIDAFGTVNTVFADDEFSEQMKGVAGIIKAACATGSGLSGFNRQTFFVKLGGFDHHDELLNNQQRLLTMLDAGLSAFNTALKDTNDVNAHDNVVTFTISDFARTLSSNGQGSDHAWGGNHIIMGGPVQGGQIFGQYPSLLLGDSNILDTGRGRLIPTTATDQYFAELALWLGISRSDLSTVLPNIANFFDTSGSNSSLPLGMLTI